MVWSDDALFTTYQYCLPGMTCTQWSQFAQAVAVTDKPAAHHPPVERTALGLADLALAHLAPHRLDHPRDAGGIELD